MGKEDKDLVIRLKFLDTPIHSSNFLGRPVPSILSILITFK